MLKSVEKGSQTGFELAVIGMSGRFPGAPNIHQFWDNLKNGIETLSFLSYQELEEAGITPGLRQDKNYVKTAGGVLENLEYFDASFFDYNPTEALVMNPQMRIFHECAWEALEDAGYDASKYNGAIGIYAGAYSSFYWQGLTQLSGKCDELGVFDSNYLNDSDFMAARIAYKLGLKGPAFTVQTACSTSLVAIHLACQGLLNGECDMALAGGVTITPGNPGGYMFQQGMIFSPDGHCRAFDARARGTTVGNGAGIVLLKTLEDAIADRDHIYALVKGAAINNDGIRKIGYSAPSMEGQAEVIRTALQLAEAESESIGYLEAHGTGTLLGDPVEIQGLKLAFNTDKKGFCAIGSVKTNIGHLDAAAGAAGFIKTVLALKYRQIPPSLHFESPNPKIDFDNSPFYVNTELKEWENHPYPLRAGVSSFGIGGTNAHIILEEFSEGTRGPSRDYQLILLSARTESTLERMGNNLANQFKKNPGINLADAAYTLQVGRKTFKYKGFTVCSAIDEAIKKMSPADAGKSSLKILSSLEESRPVLFMFPGQGSQYVNMGRQLYRGHSEPVFRETMDQCFDTLTTIMDYDLRGILYPQNSVSKLNGESSSMSTQSYSFYMSPGSNIKQTEIAQPLLFTIEYSLAKLLMAWGITPCAMIGHSIGEYVAACLAEVFSLEDALTLVALRGKLMQQMPPGAMMSVSIPEEELVPILMLKKNDRLSLAAVNGPSNCAVSGTQEALDSLAKLLKEMGYNIRPLHTSHAFHSSMMDPISREFEKKVKKIPLNKPQKPFFSNVTGQWITDEAAVDPGYWVTHLRSTVRFFDGLTVFLEKEANAVLVEVGPGRVLSTLARQHPGKKSQHLIINLIPHPKEDTADDRFLLDKIGRLWQSGVKIDWTRFYRDEKKSRVPLPTYPFDHQRFRVEKEDITTGINILEQTTPLRRKKDIGNWFYIPSWKRSPIPVQQTGETPANLCWLVFIDGCGLGTQLVKQLEQKKQAVVTVNTGNVYIKENHNQFTINPREDNNYHTLFNKLRRLELVPNRIVHLWCVTPDRSDCELLDIEHALSIQDLGFYSLLKIVRTLGNLGITNDIQLTVVTNNLQEVTGNDGLNPEKATVLGPVKVIPTEYANIKCRSIDVILPSSSPGTGTSQEQKLVRQLWEELISGSVEWAAAYRGDYRWIKTFEPIRFKELKKKHLLLKQSGVYLIIGGTGGIGLELAQYLAKEVHARLVLTSRTEFPPKNQWEQWLMEPGKDENLKRKIKKIKELEEWGAKVLVLCADVSNPKQMQKIIARAEEQFHAIDGVIHCAGLPDGEIIQRRTREKSAQIFKSKIQGTLVLDRLLQLMKKKPRFFLLCSSVTSILPMLGQVGYSAANAFLDAFAHYRNAPGSDSNHMLTVSVNWDRWRSIGIANILETEHKKLTGQDLAGGITSREGVEAFCRILANTQPQVVVSPHDIGILFEKGHLVKAPSLIKGIEGTVVAGKVLPRPQLDSEYTPPGNETEETLANLWARFFGYEKIGTRDNFFELGGDSLRAMVIASKIHKELNIQVSFQEFFNRPTIEGLVEYIEQITEKTTYVSIETAEDKEYYSLASAQKRLYILQQMDLSNISYNQSSVVILEGELEKDRLERTFRKLQERHEGLRTSFEMIKGEPVQRVRAEVDFEIEYYDLNRARVEDKVKFEEGGGAKWIAPLSKEPAVPDPQPAAVLIRSFIRPFNLTQAPLLRVGLIKLTHTLSAISGPPSQGGREHEYLLMVDMHHITADGISIGILIEDFMSLYGAGELPALRFRYRDFSEWQNLRKEKEAAKSREAFWLEDFEGEIPVLNLPTDYARPEFQDFNGNITAFEINMEQLRSIKALVRAGEATLYMFFLSIYTILLAKLGGQEDIVLGSPTAGRRHPELQPVIGMFANTLALRNYPVGEKTFQEFFAEVKERTLQALENQDYPFEDLVEKAAVIRDPSRNPIFDVMFVLQNMERKELEIPGLKLKSYEYEYNVAKFDLTLTGMETGTSLLFTLEYSTSLFKETTIGRFIRYFKIIQAKVLENSEIKIGEIEIIPGGEKKELLYDFNNTDSDYPGNKTVHQLFEEQVEHTPDRIAVLAQCPEPREHSETRHTPCTECSALSYRKLNEKSNQLARVLRIKGAKSDSIIGIMVERSTEMIVGIMGILKSSAAYLPIDPRYPEERINFMLADSRAKILVTTSPVGTLDKKGKKLRKFESNKELEIIFLYSFEDFNLYPPTIPFSHLHLPPAPVTSLAYIIYTSGSTGQPKGVTVAQRSVVNLLWALQQAYPFTPGDTYLLKTSYTFDVSVTELFGWYIGGGRLASLEINGEKDPAVLIGAIERQQVTHINFVPSMFQMFVDELSHPKISKISGLKYIFLAGEALLPELVNQFRHMNTNIALENIYGPTEAAVYSSRYSLSAWDGKRSITIGKPLQNTRLYILDRGNRLQPVGIAGELCISGIGVARGYLNRPELTAGKFIEQVVGAGNRCRWENNEKLLWGRPDASRGGFLEKSPPGRRRQKTYKTGDLARWLPDGTIEYHGRLDHQVKIRGFRIELGEIESTLKSYIKDAVVIEAKKKNRDKSLTAYIVSGENFTVTQLREYLSQGLPEYMIPSNFVKIERVPLTPGGKVDRRALLDYGGVQFKLAATYVAPGTHIEKIMVETWKNVLGLDNVGIHDNFFDLGGTSFDMIKINSILEKELEKNLPVIKMFKYPTIRSLADYLNQGENKQARVLKEEKISKKINKGKNRLKERTRRGAEKVRK
jgi:amino acid adenylation domain-containing protein